MVSWISPLFGVTFTIDGAEHLKEDRAAVVICNHQSLVDFLCMCRLWPIAGKLAAISKREILYSGPFGLIAWLSGTVFINRSSPGQSRATINDMESKIKREKVSMRA
jgi:lysophosphatidate acyltransferase